MSKIDLTRWLHTILQKTHNLHMTFSTERPIEEIKESFDILAKVLDSFYKTLEKNSYIKIDRQLK